MSVEELKRNCSTIFLLGGIGMYRKELLKFGFVSAFIDDVGHDVHYSHCVYLLFKPENMTMFQNKNWKSNNLFVTDYDYEGGYVVLVYSFPKEYLKEYEWFLEGKYSKFSKKYVDKFSDEVIVTSQAEPFKEYTLQYHIFNRTNKIKEYWKDRLGEELPEDMEMWSKPNIEHETLNINNIIHGT